MPKQKTTTNIEKTTEEEKYTQLVLQAQKNIMKCGKCKEGYIFGKETASVCECVKFEFSLLKKYKENTIPVINEEYNNYLEEQKNFYLKDIEEKECLDCKEIFRTKLKGRFRCDKCFEEYTRGFHHGILIYIPQSRPPDERRITRGNRQRLITYYMEILL